MLSAGKDPEVLRKGRVRPSVSEVCHGNRRRQSLHTCSTLSYQFLKGISLFYFLAKYFSQLWESWVHWCSSSGDSCGRGASVCLTHVSPLWVVLFSMSSLFFGMLFQLKWLEWILGLGVNAGWCQHWLGKKINCVMGKIQCFLLQCSFHLLWPLPVNWLLPCMVLVLLLVPTYTWLTSLSSTASSSWLIWSFSEHNYEEKVLIVSKHTTTTTITTSNGK